MQTRKNIIRQFLYLFIPAALVFGLIIAYLYSSGVAKERVVLEADEALHINLGKQVIEKNLEASISDLRVLSQHREFDKIDAHLSPEALEPLMQEFLGFAKSKRHYDQIRFLDEAGKEVIRVDSGSGQPRIVPQDQLQNKSGRYYFTDAMRLKEGEILISPLDLNIEHGKIERPLKPVIRLATPVLYGQGKKRGVMVLNYLGSNLLRDFKEAAVSIADHAMLLDANGFWMYNSHTVLEWGFQLDHGHTFKKQFPEAWRQITNADAGRFYNSAGLFTFATIYPLQKVGKSIIGTAVAAKPSRSEGETREYYWKVVAHVPERNLNAVTTVIAMRLLLISVPLFGLLMAGAWWLAQVQVRRLATEEALRKRERQQATVAELGQLALSGAGLATLMDTIVELVSKVLEVEYCKLLELLPDGETLLLRSGIGWREGLVGQATVDAGMDSQAGYTIANKDPVIVEDLRQETRFAGPQLLHDHGVVSGMSVIIHGVNQPFGVLGAHTSERRIFTRDDVHFLQAVANILSEVIERESAQAKTHLQTSALTAAADGIVITDREGNIQWVNPAYSRLTGYELDEVLGNNPRILKSDKQNLAFYEKLWDTILAGKIWYGELWNKRKDGSLYLEEESITPVLDKRGEVSYFIAIKRDITERQQLQKQLQQAQKMEAIGQLTGGIAHDFNNMLASILGYTELAREAIAQYDNDQIKAYLDEVYKSGTRARDLVAQMLAFSRGGETEYKPMLLAPLVKDSLKMLKTILPSSIEMSTHIDINCPEIKTDIVQVHQMIMNLCINARDAMKSEGQLGVSLRRTDGIKGVCSSCHNAIEGDFIELSVSDTGDGITQDRLLRVFDPFFTTKEAGKGTGMGLSMVHGIMHDHGGHIVVETGTKGTAFTLLFPVIDAQVDAVNVEDVDANASSEQNFIGNILIVDDDESVARFIGELLKNCGCHVTVETDSQLALKRFKEKPKAFDLVVTDQTMPKLTGAAMVEQMLKLRPELPIVLCTGYSEEIDETRANELGIRAFLMKPIRSNTLISTVKELLNQEVLITGGH